jgi:hypothetical protein
VSLCRRRRRRRRRRSRHRHRRRRRRRCRRRPTEMGDWRKREADEVVLVCVRETPRREPLFVGLRERKRERERERERARYVDARASFEAEFCL